MKKKNRWVGTAIIAILIIATLYLISGTYQTKNAGITAQQQRTSIEKTGDFFPKTFSKRGQSDARLTDPWDIWIEEQAEAHTQAVIKAIYKQNPKTQRFSQAHIERMRNQYRAALIAELSKVKEHYENPPPIFHPEPTITPKQPERYTGAQTTEAILSKFAEAYNKNWETPKIAEKYPQEEWIQMLLDKGITIEDERDFFWYQEPRRELTRIENDPSMWASGVFGIPPTDDWETYKNAYIEKKLWRHELSLNAMKSDPNSTGGIFVGENQDVFLRTTGKRVYVEREGTGAIFYGGQNLTQVQRFELLTKGVTPENYEIVYIDSKGGVLSDSPPLVTREDILNAGGTPPPEEWFNKDFSQQVPSDFEPNISVQESTDYRKFDAPNPVDETQQNAQKQIEQAQQNAERMLENITKSDAEIVTEIEKQLIPDIPTEAGFEKNLRERFSVERFNRALSTINKYGPEEGLRRLKESDPEIAEHIEKQRQR